MRRQLVPGLVVHLTVIKAKTWPGIEARLWLGCCFFVYSPEHARSHISKYLIAMWLYSALASHSDCCLQRQLLRCLHTSGS